ncbi:nose resistant to fluoxetine protein 6 [Plodia interpunctella]|uniref:nose resistant to fluoxetine protein 6 n=1 Tax=Plodia interpunctella TaxID=58824 RepID=UPI00236832EE|nr:nose resistant to fluoxetine protein 6 [Plodia interpunctella]
MLCAAILTFACALAAAQNVNITSIDNKVLQRLASLLESNRTLNTRELALLNRTAANFGIDNELVNNLTKLVRNNSEVIEDGSYVYEEGRKNPEEPPVEKSPDYASSVVLASDLLSLTAAVAKVKERACREQGYKFLDGLLLNKRFALQMFDASAKSPQGLLYGSSYHLGNFDECVGIRDRSDSNLPMDGQYCLAAIKWRESEEAKKVRTGRGEILRWAVCVPNACRANAVQDFVTDVLSHTVGNSTSVELTERDCYMRRPVVVKPLDVAFLAICLLFGAILAISTIYEIYSIKWGNQKSSIVHDLIVSFSVINNVKKIISTKQNNTLGLECVTGIKSFAMIFIVAGHACMFIASGPVMNPDEWDKLTRQPVNSLMLSNHLLVDTFLFLSAFLFSRLLLIELDKRRGRLNVIPILVFRYIRVTPAYLIVILFYMTWLPKIGEGPLWGDKIQLEQERCMDSWWANILYINNYVNTDKLCMFQSWYLSVDTQLFFIAPIFIYSLWRWSRIGPVFLSFCIVITLVVPSVITYIDRLDPTILFYAKDFTDFAGNFYFKEAYIKTHMKMVTYLMGILTGYILHRIQSENYTLSRTLKFFAWITSIVLGSVTVFSVSVFYQEWYEYNVIEAAAYISLHKLAWGIANGWLIVACATGCGGWMCTLLKWKFLVPISRLTFCAYLVNGVVELYYVGQLRHPMHVTIFTITANAISHMVLTFLLAFILCITFESPIHGIEKILLRTLARPVLSDNAVKGQPSSNTSQSKPES